MLKPIRKQILKNIVGRVLKYSPEISLSLNTRSEISIENHVSELFHLRRSFFKKSNYNPIFANDAFFLYAYEYLSKHKDELTFLNEEDNQKLSEVLLELETFNNYMNLMDELFLLVNGFERIHIKHHKDTSMSSINQKMFMDGTDYQDFQDMLKRYEELMNQMEGYPLWQNKLAHACNKYIQWFYIFHTGLEPSLNLTDLFDKHKHFM